MNAYGDILKNQAPVSAIGPYRLRMKDGVYAYHIGYIAPFMEDGKMTKILLVTKSIEDKIKESEQSNAEKNPPKETSSPSVIPSPLKNSQLVVDQISEIQSLLISGGH
jgi:hypothetical protein